MTTLPHDRDELLSDPLTDHEYDGIKEFDNPTPGWWYAIFASTVVFSVLYLVFFHFSVFGWTIQEEWASREKAEFKRIFGAVGTLPADEGTILTQMNNPKFMSIARATFIGNCAACHEADGGGAVGVNLTDDSYKSVKNVVDLYTVITDGAANGAMPPWGNRLSQNERVILASYVASLRGTTPKVSKAAEGTVIPPWPKAPEASATPAAGKP